MIKLLNIVKKSDFTFTRFAARENRRILMRYIMIYVLYMLVLFLVLFSAIQISGKMFMQRTIRIAEETIRTGVNELEVTLDSYRKTGQVLLSSPSLIISSASAKNYYYKLYAAHQFYSDIVATLENQPPCLLFLSNGTLMASGRYYENPADYYPRAVYCEDFKTYEEWISYIGSPHNGAFLPALEYRIPHAFKTIHAITYLVKGLSSYNDRSMFMVLIPTKEIEQTLLPSSQTLTGNITLYARYNDSRVVLYENNIYPKDTCIHSVTYTGRSGLSVQLDIADSVIDAEMQDVWTGYYLFSAAFILIGLFFALILAYHNTRPIAVLMRAAVQLDSTGQINATQERLTDEYSYLLSVLANSGAALKSYEKELIRHVDETRYWAFASMLMGENTDIPIDLCCPPYTLMVIHPSNSGSVTSSLILTLLRDLVASYGNEQLCALVRQNIVILIRENHYQSLKAGISNVLDQIQQLHHRLISIPSLATITEICDAYAQAVYMLSLPSEENRTIHETKLASHSEAFDETLSHLTQFSFSSVLRMLTSGQIDSLTNMLDECIELVRTGGYIDEPLVRYVYDSCNIAITAVSCKFPDITFHLSIPEFSEGIAHDRLFTDLRSALIHVHEQMRSYYESGSIQQASKIIAFIDENITNPDLYSKLCISKFDITEPELQSLVRSVSNMSFFNYVEKARMTKAQQLIFSTELSVTEISEKCGYNSHASFTRAFNRYYGMSPTKMRNNLER